MIIRSEKELAHFTLQLDCNKEGLTSWKHASTKVSIIYRYILRLSLLLLVFDMSLVFSCNDANCCIWQHNHIHCPCFRRTWPCRLACANLRRLLSPDWTMQSNFDIILHLILSSPTIAALSTMCHFFSPVFCHCKMSCNHLIEV